MRALFHWRKVEIEQSRVIQKLATLPTTIVSIISTIDLCSGALSVINRCDSFLSRIINFRVPQLTSTTGRLEISICKTAAEPLGFKPFSKVF